MTLCGTTFPITVEGIRNIHKQVPFSQHSVGRKKLSSLGFPSTRLLGCLQLQGQVYENNKLPLGTGLLFFFHIWQIFISKVGCHFYGRKEEISFSINCLVKCQEVLDIIPRKKIFSFGGGGWKSVTGYIFPLF